MAWGSGQTIGGGDPRTAPPGSVANPTPYVWHPTPAGPNPGNGGNAALAPRPPGAVPPPPAPPPPAAPPPAPAPPAAPAYASPLDSTYFNALGQAQFAANNKINAYDQSSGYARIDLQNALDKLAHQQPIDTLNEQQHYNKSGLLYSGHLGQALGELNYKYLNQQSADQQGFARAQAARDAAVAALKGGLTLTQAALYAAAVDRASKKAAADPTLGVKPIDPGTGGTGGSGGGSKPPPAPKAASKPGYFDPGGQGAFNRTYWAPGGTGGKWASGKSGAKVPAKQSKSASWGLTKWKGW